MYPVRPIFFCEGGVGGCCLDWYGGGAGAGDGIGGGGV